MKTFLLNLKIRYKIALWYSVISLLFIILGFKFYSLLSSYQKKHEEISAIIRFEGTIKNAKYIVRAEMQTAASLVNAENNKQINDWWNEHQNLQKTFNNGFSSLKEFATINKKENYENQTNEISKILSEIDDTYQKIVASSFEKIYQLKTDKLEQANTETMALDTVQSLDAIMKMNLDLSTGQQTAKEAVLAEMKQLLTYIDFTGFEIIKKFDATTKITESLSTDYERTINEESSKSILNTIVFLFLIFLIILSISVYISNLFSSLLTKINDILVQLSQGELQHSIQIETTDEIGTMSLSLNKLVEGLQRTAEFSIQIGVGNFESEYAPLGENDVLGNSLLNMRKSLQTSLRESEKRQLEDELRNWATEGIAKAWISNITDPKDTATGIGTFAGFQSLAAMVASSLAGLLWFWFGVKTAFLATSVVTVLVIIYFALAIKVNTNK